MGVGADSIAMGAREMYYDMLDREFMPKGWCIVGNGNLHLAWQEPYHRMLVWFSGQVMIAHHGHLTVVCPKNWVVS